jgi:hypothetical protein
MSAGFFRGRYGINILGGWRSAKTWRDQFGFNIPALSTTLPVSKGVKIVTDQGIESLEVREADE